MRAFGLVVLVSLFTGSGLVGCFDKEEATCEYWKTKLTSASRADKALQMMEELKCADAIPILEQLFDEGQFRERIVRILKQIGDKQAAAPLLRKALKQRDTGKLAAEIVTDWKLKAAKPELVSILTEMTLPKHREKALKALLSFETLQTGKDAKGHEGGPAPMVTVAADVEDLLIKLAVDDMNAQGHEVNRLAIETLGDMRSVKAVPALVQAAFMRTNQGAKVYQAVRQALAKVGPASVPHLIQTADGKNTDLHKYAKENGIYEWEITSGPEIVQMMTDTLDKKVMPAVVRNMTQEIKEPIGLSEHATEAWRMAQLNRLQTVFLGAGHMKLDNTLIEPLMKLFKDTLADAVNQRLKAASIIAFIGTKEAQDALLLAYKEETDQRFQAPFLFPVVEAVDFDHMPVLDELLKEPPKLVAMNLKLERVVGNLKVPRDCKNDVGCIIKKLESEDKWQVLKAALVLARGIGDKKEVLDALLKRFSMTPRDQIDVRRFTLMAITRLGDAATGQELLRMAKTQEPADKYWPGELSAYGHYMTHMK